MERTAVENQPRCIPFILSAGASAALLATIMSALEIAVFSAVQPWQGTTSPSIWEIGRSTLLLCPITAVSCGSFGFLAGIIGSSVLYVRRRRIHRMRRLLIESGIAGFLLGLTFPFFDHLINPPSLTAMQILLSAPIGLFCALICGLIFRNHFVKE